MHFQEHDIFWLALQGAGRRGRPTARNIQLGCGGAGRACTRRRTCTTPCGCVVGKGGDIEGHCGAQLWAHEHSVDGCVMGGARQRASAKAAQRRPWVLASKPSCETMGQNNTIFSPCISIACTHARFCSVWKAMPSTDVLAEPCCNLTCAPIVAGILCRRQVHARLVCCSQNRGPGTYNKLHRHGAQPGARGVVRGSCRAVGNADAHA